MVEAAGALGLAAVGGLAGAATGAALAFGGAVVGDGDCAGAGVATTGAADEIAFASYAVSFPIPCAI